VHWVAPKLVAEIEYTELTREGIVRHPRFRGIRSDKTAAEVRKESVKPSSRRSRQAGGRRRSSRPVH
jgi:bifunctional non-homologous end joining protein LigD